MTRLAAILSAGVLGCAAALPVSASAKAGPAAARPAPVPACADLLGQMHKTPVHVVYAGCRYFPDRQGKPLVATYRVGGRFAAAAEASLVRSVGLDRLKRSCCQWDAPARQFRDARGREYAITMVSDETTIATRAAWSRIARFEITVTLLTEEI